MTIDITIVAVKLGCAVSHAEVFMVVLELLVCEKLLNLEQNERMSANSCMCIVACLLCHLQYQQFSFLSYCVNFVIALEAMNAYEKCMCLPLLFVVE